jgi:dTDP-4-dehydrorhamnose reductase
MRKRRVLVLGAKGMLGQELLRVYREDAGCEAAGWDYEEINLTDFPMAEKKIRAFGPDVILNAVAYNAVDRCEESDEEYAKALRLNAEVPGFLARLARESGATLIHYSTDYVFDGENAEGYTETAKPNPISRYGVSKREGEKNVMAQGGGHYVVRLSKLFGKPAISATGKKSFFEKMLEVARERREVAVVDDEKSCFTYASDLARASKVLEEEGKPSGIYHLTNEGAATWYEAARELFRIAGIDVVLKPVSTDVFPRPAKRPHFSVLRNTKFLPLRPYEEALAEFLGDQSGPGHLDPLPKK